MHEGRPVSTFVCAGLLVLSGVMRGSQSSLPGPPGNPAAPVTTAGKVTDSQGRPIEGAKVAVYRVAYGASPSAPKIDVIQETTTGAEGEFTFSGSRDAVLPPGSCVVARKEGLAVGWAARRMRGEQRFDITLEEPKDLSGQVVDEQGQPVAGAEVSVAAAANGKPADPQDLGIWTARGFFHTKTDGSGRFVFVGMPAGATFELLVSKPGYATVNTMGPMRVTPGGPVKLQFAPDQPGTKLTLFREARIEGIVVEKEGDKPVAGVSIMIQPEPGAMRLPMPMRPVVSGPDGTFRTGDLAAGSYTVQLVTGRTAEWAAEPVPVSLSAGQTKSDVKIMLVKGGIIEVLVKDTAGKPVARAQADLQDVAREQQTHRALTDPNGLARVRVTPGRYVLARVFVEGRVRPTDEEQITVAEGETKRIECTVNPAPKLAGIVRDEAGHPLAGVTFEFVPTMLSRDEITSDASGKFEVPLGSGIIGPRGSTLVLVARDKARNLAEAVDVDEQGGTLDVTLRPGVVITGTVLNEQDQPLAGARVRIMMRTPRMTAPLERTHLATAGPDGKFEIQALPPEREYTVTVVADGFGSRNVRVDPGSIQDNRFDAGTFKLVRATLSITGIVVDPNDKPVAGVDVFGYGDGQPDSLMMRTDAEGKFILKGVCPGLILLQANARRGPRPMYGMAQAEGGATDLRIVISTRPTGQPYMPRRPNLLKGKPLPPLKDLGIDLPADATDKMLLVCFWDMGQRPSRNCITRLAAQAAALREKGVRIVAIHAGQVEDSALRQWIEANKIPFASGTISGNIDKTKSVWGVSSLPHLILTDKKRTVIAEGLGLDDLDKQIEAAVR
jgi:protocatechuate 3,4-dioxygenase beta subunit